MVSLVLTVFLVQLAIHIVNAIGSAALGDLIWRFYNTFPTSTSGRYKEVVRLRKEAFDLKQKLNATSAQDEFAKWAKLQRQYDKVKAEYDKKSGDLQALESSFKAAASALRMITTNGVRFILQFWYGPLAMFWLPKGWMPGYIEWLLAFPKAPSGSISIQVWFMACASIVAVLWEGLVAIWALGAGSKTVEKKATAMPARQQEKAHAQ